MIKEHDFIAIGGGSGGYNGARVARQYSDNVAIVDGAKKKIGKTVVCEVTSLVQTASGRMVFARMDHEGHLDSPPSETPAGKEEQSEPKE